MKELSVKKQRIFVISVFSLFLFTLLFGFVYDTILSDKNNNEKTTTKAKIDSNSNSDIPTNLDEEGQEINKNFLAIDFSKIKLPTVTEEINNKKLSDYAWEFKDIIKAISLSDKNFNPNDYKVYYQNINNEKKISCLNFIYYINQKIETNKVYITDLIGSNVQSIILGGIKKENLINLEKIDLNGIESKIKVFEQNKSEILLNKIPQMFTSDDILKSDGKINMESVDQKIQDLTERYYYNYNSNKLIYRLGYVINTIGTATLGQAAEIDL